jgi:hypothetical protein
MTSQRRGETKAQGRDERIRYALDAEPAAVAVQAVTVRDETAQEDVTSACTAESALVQDGKPVTPVIHSLLPGHIYRAEVRYTDAGGNVLEPFFLIEGER